MATLMEFDARIARTERLNNTAQGNPRFKVHLVGGMSPLKTEPNAGYTFELCNGALDGKKVTITVNAESGVIQSLKRKEG